MTEQQLLQELEALRAENKFLKAQNATISKELDSYIQNLSKSDFEKLIKKAHNDDDEYFKSLAVIQVHISELTQKYISQFCEKEYLKTTFEKQNKLIEELSDLTDDLMLETITTRDGETYDIYTCSELTYDLINKTMKMLMEYL